MDYSKYLRSKHWREFRLEVIEAADNHCAICYSKGYLRVHHNNYERLGKERLSDVVVLCSGCHALFHDKLPEHQTNQIPSIVLSVIQEHPLYGAGMKAASCDNGLLVLGVRDSATMGLVSREKRDIMDEINYRNGDVLVGAIQVSKRLDLFN